MARARYVKPQVTCKGTKRNGKPCNRPPMRSEEFCMDHLHVEVAPLGTDAAIAARVESHELTPRVRPTLEAVDPILGEVIVLGEASHAQLHGLLVNLAVFGEQLKATKQMVEREVVDRMDGMASWTIHTDYGDMVSGSPAPTVVIQDPKGLRDALMAEGGYREDVADSAVKMDVPEPTYTPVKKGLNALMKVAPARSIIQRFSELVPKSHRSVSLKRTAR